MKLDIKKTGLIIAASSAFMVANAFAEGVTAYGNFGIELHQTSTKSGKDADSVGGLGLKDGSSRLGIKGVKTFQGGAVANVTGHFEVGAGFDADTGGSAVSVRHSNVQIALRSGGTLGLGQQDNLRVSSGWNTGGDASQASALSDGRAVNGGRYTGIKYVHDFGVGSFGIMLGIDDTDDGAAATADTYTTRTDFYSSSTGTPITTVFAKTAGTSEKATNAIDKMTILLSLKPTNELGVQIGYDKKEGDLADDAETQNVTALTVSYSLAPISVHIGYGMLKKENVASTSLKEENKTDMSLNLAFNAGGVTPFAGFRQTTGDSTAAAAGSTKQDLETQTAISIGANFSLLGGSAFAGYDSVSNNEGTEGAEVTRIMTGLFYSF